MNHGIYRLIFNDETNTWVAAAEIVRARGKKGSRPARRHLAVVALGLSVATASALAGPSVPPATQLPVPHASKPFVFAGRVTNPDGLPTTNGNAMTINTDSRALGLNWNSFDIGSSASVTFNQPDSTSRVLNRIWDSNPSQIMGQLKANGQVFMINQNGILFGAGAQVNVGGLFAAAMNLPQGTIDRLLNSGLPANKGERMEFAYDGLFKDFANGTVIVDAGATIRTRDGGRVVLIAPKTVENRGLIETVDGQDESQRSGQAAEAILAAGGKVILAAPDDPNLRGLLVETQAQTVKDDLGNNVALNGTVTNTGTINLNDLNNQGGKISLAALAVNQKGIVKATQAVNLNGTTMLVSGNTQTDKLTVNQRGSVAEIDWVSGFNVGDGSNPGENSFKSVEFVQSSSGDVVYNYIHDADRKAADGSVLNQAQRSSIDGKLTANGQLFLINEKGFDFKSGARVSAANFVASALGMNPAIAKAGIFSLDGATTRSFYLSETPWKANASSASDPVEKAAEEAANLALISVQAKNAFDQATVDIAKEASIKTTVDNGFVLLLGTHVNQEGSVTTPKGQTLIAAGADIYLKPPFTAGLRGFTAEVNPLYVIKDWTSGKDWEILDHGSITNTGRIESMLGDITLAAFNVTQAGTLWATTSATANGSIHLQARDRVSNAAQRNLNNEGVAPYSSSDVYSDDKAISPLFAVGQDGGTLTLAAGSVTEVAIDGSGGKTIAPDQTFITSSIDAIAKKINIEGTTQSATGASITAHGGRIRMMAQDSFSTTSGFIGDPVIPPQTATVSPQVGVGIFVGDGATLDTSGSIAKKSASDLFVEVEFLGDEFAGNPVQRSSILRGQKAWVDVRDKVSIADLSGWIGKIGQTVEEKTSSGGTISMRSTGSVVIKQGASLDVSGGQVNYAAGTVSESRVTTDRGKTYRLNDAPATDKYVSLSTVQKRVAAYSEGKNAGTVELSAHSLAVDGTLKATTTPGAKQRNVGNPASDRYAAPLGGQLIIKDIGQHYVPDTLGETDKMAAYTQAQIAFVKGQAHAADGLGVDSIAGPRLELSDALVGSGFSRFNIQSDGRIDIPAEVSLNLAAGGSFTASGRQVHVAGDITVPSGSISLTTRDMSQANGDFPSTTDAKHSTLVLEDGASLSVAGQWINDYLDGPASTRSKAIQGGKISLNSAYDLDLRSGSRIDVSGGGRLGTDGKLESGNAGSIALSTGGMGKAGSFEANNDDARRDASLFLDGTLAAYALGTGGKLEINTSALRLGETFASDSRDWSRTKRLATGQVGAALDAGFFDRGGIFEFKLVGRDGVTVKGSETAEGRTVISPTPVSWALLKAADYRYMASGTALDSFARPVVLHSDQRRAPTKLTLATRSLNYGNLTVGENAYLGVSPQGSIALESWGQLNVFGTLDAPSGTISLSRPAVQNTDDYNQTTIAYSERKQSQSIFLGANSRLLARGTTVLDASTRTSLEGGVSADTLISQQRYKGQVLDGGRIDLDAGLGYLITASGSLMDVSGAQDTLNVATSAGKGNVAYPLQTVGSSGGRIALAAREGMLLDGDYAAAGKNGALGGTFSARLYELAKGSWLTDGLPASMSGPRQITLSQSSGGHPEQWTLNAEDTAAYLEAAASPPRSGSSDDTTLLDSANHNGKAEIDLAQLNAAGFGSWYIAAKDEIRFDGTIDSTVANQLRLDAPRFSTTGDATSVAFKAAAIQLGNQAPAGTPATSALTGNAKATFSALDIGVIGNFTWNGFGTSTFISQGEIHFDSTANTAANRTGGRKFSGQMTASGQVEFSAARLSPSTYSDYRIDLSSDDRVWNGEPADDPYSKIMITRPDGAWADVSLAAGGRLEFAAKTIAHEGTVTAPLGEIVFSGHRSDGTLIPGSSVTLSSDSITSVAADRLLMLGETDQSGRLWVFKSTYWDPATQSLGSETYTVAKAGETTAANAPAKAIRVDSADSTIEHGATIDLSGGGDAMAWEFTTGPGGKADALLQSGTSDSTLFAILPSWQGRFMQQDSGAMATSYSPTDSTKPIAAYNVSNSNSDGTKSDFVASLKAGDQIQIGSGSDLAAGSYTLLPARYALLPGAFLVSVKKSSDATLAGARRQADGSWLVSGSRTAANADGSATAYSQRPLTIEVASSATTANRARYTTTTASDFFYNTPGANLPGDAGRLSVVGRNKLSFDPTIIAERRLIETHDKHTRPGRGLEIDLAAPKLLISDNGGTPVDGWSVIDQDKLNKLGASSLLIGGTRSIDGDTTRIDTISTDVQVDNHGASDAAKALSGPEILMTSLSDITINSGSRVDDGNSASSGGVTSKKIVLNALAQDNNDLNLKKGDNAGAFLRVASGDQATLSRQGTVVRTQGDLTLEEGSRIAGKSVILDATHKTALPGQVEVGALQANGSRSGGAVTIGADRINVVGDGSVPTEGLTLSNASLERFAEVDQLRLTSYSTFDLYGDAVLGSANLKELDISAAGIAGHGSGDSNAVLSAKTLRLDNLNPKASTFAATGEGGLTLSADTLIFGDNATSAMRTADDPGFAIRGFNTVLAKAKDDIRFEGTGVTSVDNTGGSGTAANLTLDAERVTTSAGANHRIQASGTGTIKGGSDVAKATGLGGALEIGAASLDVSGRIDLPSGNLTLTASSGDLNVNAGADLRATGSAVQFADTLAYAPGGKIVLNAIEGNIDIKSGAKVSVDGAGGDAGQLALIARKGNVAAAANTLRGKTDASNSKLRQGELKVDAATLSLDQLASAIVVDTLADGSIQRNFSGLWDIRSRNGNLALAADSTIGASQVKLAADNGNIDISGTIDASGKKGGSIELYANRGTSAGGRVDLRAGSTLKANATASVGSGQGSAGQGGRVIIGVSASDAANEMATGIGFEGTKDDKSAASIDVSTPAGSEAEQGKVIFSAPRKDSITQLKTLDSTAGNVDITSPINVVAASGTASAFTLSSTLTEYKDGMLAVFKAPASNSGALTLNVNGQGERAVLKADGTPLSANDILANQVVVATYDGTAFRISATGQQDTGTGAAYAVALPTKPTALTPGQIVTFQAKSANAAGTVTLTLNGDNSLRKNLLREDGTALGSGYITASQLVTAVYTGSEFRIVRDTNLVASGILDSTLAPVTLAGNIVGANSVVLQGMATTRKTGDFILDFKQQALLMAATNQSAAASAHALRKAADPGSRLNLSYQQGIDVLATGDISVTGDWALGSARYLGSPGLLSLRAGGNININATISDGFSPVSSSTARNELSRDAALNTSGDSWSYRFAAGVETNTSSMAANPLAVLDAPAAGDTTTKGSITVAAGKLVRTGTGTIDMAARRDITLLDLAAVYTAGINDTSSMSGFSPITSGTAANSINSIFPTSGGDVSLIAGNSLIMAKNVVGEVITPPDLRHVNQWLFRAGDARNVQWWSRIGSFEQGVATLGGGDVRLEAGSDVKYFTAATPTNGRVPEIDGEHRTDLANIQGGGDLSVRAGGSVIGGLFYADAGSLKIDSAEIKGKTGIALGNADAQIAVKGSVDLGNVFNPLMVKSDRVYNEYNTQGVLTSVKKFSGGTDQTVRLGNYGANSALDLLSVTGNVILAADNSFYGVLDPLGAHTLAPSRVKVAALNGNISGQLSQVPGSNGQLDLLAAESIILNTASIRQLDLPASALPSIGNPLTDMTTNLSPATASERHSASPWHQNDTEASRLIALNGNITGHPGASNYAEFSEAVYIAAGGDITDLSLTAQHLRDTDVSTVSAQGDIEFTLNSTPFPSKGIKISGPGRLEVMAAGNIDLGDSKGIISNGNLENPYLPEGGADIFAMAGSTAPDYAGFLKYLEDNQLEIGSDTSDAGLRNRFYSVLRDFGREAVNGGGEASYEKGRAAIRAFFPVASVKAGNIDLFYSTIKTEQGGNIDMLAPGGSITVGIATPNKDLMSYKKSSEQGLFSIRGGAIRAMVHDNFLVNQSRVFTLDGGDVLVWADQGNIDAGSGAKTVSATPPPVLLVRDRQIVLDASNSISGSGIGVLKSRDTSPTSDMDLFAPQGAIDAGDAGLRSTGNINLGAAQILNSSNIQASGAVSGAPAAATTSAPTTAVTSPTDTKSNGAADVATTTTRKDEALGVLTVEVLGGGAAPDDSTPTDDEEEEKRKKKKKREAV